MEHSKKLAQGLACLLLAAVAVWGDTLCARQRLEIDIVGIEGALLENVRAHLSIAELAPATVPALIPPFGKGEQIPELTENELRRRYRRAPGEIEAALQPFGYYEPVIDTSLDLKGDTWVARFSIDTGPPVLIDSIDIQIAGEGRDDPGIRNALAASRLKIGRRLEHPDYDNTKESLLKAALAAGYLDAAYSRAELRILKSARAARIVLYLDTGPRFYFGEIRIQQQILDPDFVNRFIHIRPGEPFDTEKLLKLQLALSDSGYFSTVEVQSRRVDAVDQRIPVVIDTVPAKPRRYGYGLGYGTDTGPRFSLAADYPRINRRGHGLFSDIRVSRILKSVGTQYRIPIGNLVSDRLVFSGRADFETIAGEGETDRYTLGASQNIEWGPFQRRLYLNFQHEKFNLGEDDDTVTYLIPGLTLSQLKTDNVLFPRRGYSWTADLRGSAGVISESSFTRAVLGGRFAYPLGAKSRVLMRAELGATAAAEFDKLPTTERFFAGGDQSVRGYGYQKLGPRDDSGDVIGGRYLAVGSIELDYLFAGKFGAAIFVDSGNADDNFLPSLKTGAGVGFRWKSPVGMLRIDVAHPFTDTDNNYRFHISIGPDL